MRARGVHVQSDRVRVADPSPTYVDAALSALTEACIELGVPEAFVAFVETVDRPPRFGLRYGFQGGFTTDAPGQDLDLRELDADRRAAPGRAARGRAPRVRTDAYAEESAGHSGPSETFALAFEASS